MTRKNLFAALFFTLAISSASAQLYDGMFSASWDITAPLSNKTFAGSGSAAGARLGFQKFVRENISVGFEFGFNSYSHYEPRRTYYSDNGALTTDFHNSLTSVTGALTGNYFFKTEGKIIPFASIGLGVGHQLYDQLYNVYESTGSNTGFLSRPALGILFRAKDYSAWGFLLSTHLDLCSGGNDTLDTDPFRSFGVTLGVIFFGE